MARKDRKQKNATHRISSDSATNELIEKAQLWTESAEENQMGKLEL